MDFTRALPGPLKNDETMLTLGRVIAGELQENIQLARGAIIYPRIDELPEEVLDILARDLRVDWYEDTYPIDVKRATIRDSVKVHKRLGTKYAVETALGNVFPGSRLEEWFEYGGQPYMFRVSVNAADSERIPNWKEKVRRAIALSKNLRSHLDALRMVFNDIQIENIRAVYITRNIHRLTLPTPPAHILRAACHMIVSDRPPYAFPARDRHKFPLRAEKALRLLDTHRLILPSNPRQIHRVGYRLSFSPFNLYALAYFNGEYKYDGAITWKGYADLRPYPFPSWDSHALSMRNPGVVHVPGARFGVPLLNANHTVYKAVVSARFENPAPERNTRLTTAGRLRNPWAVRVPGIRVSVPLRSSCHTQARAVSTAILQNPAASHTMRLTITGPIRYNGAYKYDGAALYDGQTVNYEL